MKFRDLVFWFHLGCGVSAGLVILMMSITGVLLTYERQMISWIDNAGLPDITASGERQTLENIIKTVTTYTGGKRPSSISVENDPLEHVTVTIGRDEVFFVDPYSGTVAGEGSNKAREFFGTVTRWHRWFDVSGDGRDTARAITGACNIIFLVLILTGMYLWLPKAWKWSHFRVRVFFNRHTITSKARDFNWHHVFGIWSCLPLAVVVATAIVFSYPSASNLVYRVYGESPPERAGGPGPPLNTADTAAYENRQTGSDHGLEKLLVQAASREPGWRSITFRVNDDPALPVTFTVDNGNGGQPQKQLRVTVDRFTGSITSYATFAEQSPGQRARVIIRRLHTGEVFGVAGQTVAGMVSFAGIILVYTGLALAYRRLIKPLFHKPA